MSLFEIEGFGALVLVWWMGASWRLVSMGRWP